MNIYIEFFLIALPIFLVIDLIWLIFISKKFYAKHLTNLIKPNVNWLAAIIFYLLFIVGLIIFVIQPGFESKSLLRIVLSGGLFGLVTYATYDLTNLATLKGWPLIVTIVDLFWGMFLSISTSCLTYLVAVWIGI